MENKGLLFIPDISGFTRFINETEIDHSRLIIQELLEIIINANETGLEISEIEGDAILFYKFGSSPDLPELFRQVEKMFCEFHRHLVAYEYRRFCQCAACTSAINLTLKVITHYGEFTGYNVKNFRKLIGRDIIVAHQLLKNDIDEHEYWLVTKDLMKDEEPKPLAQWMEWNTSVKKTESGEVSFHYAQLGQLKHIVKAEPVPLVELAKKTKVFSITKEYETDIISLFHATGDFSYRSKWQEGIKAIEEVSHFLPRIGTRCRCVLENGQSYIYASSYSYQPDRIEFSETEEKEKTVLYFTLEKLEEQRTKLTLDYYLPKSFFKELLFRLKHKKQNEEYFKKSMDNLTTFVKTLNIKTATPL